MPEGESLVSVSSYSFHSCGLRLDGTAVCWGHDVEGQTKPPRRKEFRSISSGYTHTCALEVDGTPVCWGADLNGVTSPPKREGWCPSAAERGMSVGCVKTAPPYAGGATLRGNQLRRTCSLQPLAAGLTIPADFNQTG